MPTQGFFAALSRVRYKSGKWKALAAGLVVMRRVEESLEGVMPSEALFREARSTVMLTENTVLATDLLEMLDAAIATAFAPLEYREILCSRLHEYGLTLRKRGFANASVDVFRMVCDHGHDDAEARLDAIRQLAYSLRTLNQYDEAESAYRWLCEDSDRLGSDSMHLIGLLGVARCTCERGNFADGSRLLDAVISRADAKDDRDIQDQAMVDRACVAGRLRDHEGAYRLATLALRSLQDEEQRDRCLVVLAAACRETRRGEQAVSAATMVLSHDVALDVRAEATITLYEVATDCGDAAEQERHQSWLEHEILGPLAGARFAYARSVAQAVHGDWDGARAHIDAYLAIVDANELFEERVRGDEALVEINKKRVPAFYDVRPAPRSHAVTIVGFAGVAGAHDVSRTAPTVPV